MNSVTLNGRDRELTRERFTFDRVTEDVDFLLIDDAHHYLDFDFFFKCITDSWNIQAKHLKSYEIPFERSPKMAISTNYSPKNFDTPVHGRLLFMVFSDYYHEKTPDNDYRETRTIRNDFNMELHDLMYHADDWNTDINFLTDCLQFYLSTVGKQVKINPPMKNIQQRMYESNMGEEGFHEWALTYFSTEGDNVNKAIIRSVAHDNYIDTCKPQKFKTMQKFNKGLQAFCRKYGYTLNPKDMHTTNGRIQEKIDGKMHDMIYVQTVQTALFPINSSDSDSSIETPF